MGFSAKRKGNVLQVSPSHLHGASVRATDLRGGAALVLAALAAEGETVIESTEYIERGYERFASKLSSLGASIEWE